MKGKVVFLDRDGVINKDSPDYIKSWSEFEFLPRSLKALRHLKENGYAIFLITNQSVIHRKFVSKNDLESIHSRMIEVIRQHGGEIEDVFYCPHIPEDRCDCRKPKPGLIRQVQGKYQVDVNKTIMVGDSVKDIECAINAGCAGSILVQTGNGIDAERILIEKNIRPSAVVKDLYEAAQWLTHAEKKIIDA